MLSYNRLANFIIFQLAWFAAILNAAAGADGIAVLICCLACGFHIFMVEHKSLECGLIALCLTLGLAIDGFNFHIGLLVPSQPLPILFVNVPLWLLGMWALFATTLRHSIAWLSCKPLLSALLGAIIAPISYYAGIRFGALSQPVVPNIRLWSAIAVEWALIVPVLFRVSAIIEQRMKLSSEGINNRVT